MNTRRRFLQTVITTICLFLSPRKKVKVSRIDTGENFVCSNKNLREVKEFSCEAAYDLPEVQCASFETKAIGGTLVIPYSLTQEFIIPIEGSERKVSLIFKLDMNKKAFLAVSINWGEKDFIVHPTSKYVSFSPASNECDEVMQKLDKTIDEWNPNNKG